MKASATELWVQKWNEYWSITQDGVTHNQRYTWNHLLLKEHVQPLPMGLCWDFSPASQTHGPYFHLSERMAQTIGLGCLNARDSMSQLLKLDVQEIERRNLHDALLSELQPLLSLCNRIDKQDDERRDLPAVAWKIFHLVRSYALWGGGAFISVPVVIGTAGMSHTAVLSVCSKKPLSSQAYRDWSFMAEVLLRPLVEEDMFNLVKEHGFAEAVYSIGHPFKHRFNDLSGGVRGLFSQVEQLDFEIKNKVGDLHRNTLLQHSGRVLETADSVCSSSETCRRVSDLMNFISSFRATDSSARLEGKYLVKTPYHFAKQLPCKDKCLPLPFTRWFNGKCKQVVIEDAD
ncbi:MAG: hypothetical protein AAB393_01655, partial [Bacteroidota bacterium]